VAMKGPAGDAAQGAIDGRRLHLHRRDGPPPAKRPTPSAPAAAPFGPHPVAVPWRPPRSVTNPCPRFLHPFARFYRCGCLPGPACPDHRPRPREGVVGQGHPRIPRPIPQAWTPRDGPQGHHTTTPMRSHPRGDLPAWEEPAPPLAAAAAPAAWRAPPEDPAPQWSRRPAQASILQYYIS